MARKKRRRPVVHYDSFHCTVEDWRWEYHFGAMIPERKYDDSGHHEWDWIRVFTKVRHHDTSRMKSSRKFESIEFCLHPDHELRGKFSKEAIDIGLIMFDRRMLRAHVHLASDVYYSLIPCLATNHLKEISLSVRNLRYWRGDIQSIAFNPEEVPFEEIQEGSGRP